MKQHEREAAQALIDYLAEHYLTSGEAFREFIRASRLATGITFRQGLKGYALDLFAPDTIDAHPRGLRTYWETEGEALRELARARARAEGNYSAATSPAEYDAAQALIDYLAEHMLTSGKPFRDFIRATRLATGFIFEDAEGFSLDLFAPGTIADFPHGHRTTWETREQAEAALARIKANTPPNRTSYAAMTLGTLISAYEAGEACYCDGDAMRWHPITAFGETQILIRA